MALNLFSLIGAWRLAHTHTDLWHWGWGRGAGRACYLFHWDAEIQAYLLYIKQNTQHTHMQTNATLSRPFTSNSIFFPTTFAFKEKQIHILWICILRQQFFSPNKDQNIRIAHTSQLILAQKKGSAFIDLHGIQLHDAQSYSQNRKVQCWIISSLLDRYDFRIVPSNSKPMQLWQPKRNR